MKLSIFEGHFMITDSPIADAQANGYHTRSLVKAEEGPQAAVA